MQGYFHMFPVMPPTLYASRGSPQIRAILVTAKALGLPLNLQVIDAKQEERRAPGLIYLQLTPRHTVPSLVDCAQIIHDSHAIIAYLVEKYGKDDTFYPKCDLHKRALIDVRTHFDIGVLFPLLRSIILPLFYKEVRNISPKKLEEVQEAYRSLEIFLRECSWIAGECVSIADFSCVTTVTSLALLVPPNSELYPNVHNWIKKVEKLPWFASDHEEFEVFKQFINSILS